MLMWMLHVLQNTYNIDGMHTEVQILTCISYHTTSGYHKMVVLSI